MRSRARMKNPGAARFISGPCALEVRDAGREGGDLLGLARRREWRQVKGVCLMRIRFDNTQSDRGRGKWLHDFTRERHRTRERVPEGRGPASKVRTLFEDAQPFQQVRILEKPGDSFEGAHLFPRCARKLRTFERSAVRARGDGRRLVFPNIAEPSSDSYLERADPSSPIRELS